MSKKTRNGKGKGKDKEKKEKIVYVDDGSTVADMSNTRKKEKGPPKRKSTMKEKWRTYLSVVKKMILPMLCTLLAFTLIYIFLLLITGNLF